MSVSKRQKEKERQDRRREKEAKREERRREKANRAPLEAGEDPDIAGIVPGPQPLPDELLDPEDDDTAAESR